LTHTNFVRALFAAIRRLRSDLPPPLQTSLNPRPAR
jgi:hypothetical protein